MVSARIEGGRYTYVWTSVRAKFVLMDGDNTQYNACTTELPSTTVLMCWYHVLTNVFKQCKARGVELSQTALFFKELYDLHFAPRSVFEDLKRRVIARWDSLTPGSAAYGVTQYILSSSLNNERFGKWQAFHTPSGCCTTTNPLEQYHRTLKRFCSNPRAAPRELLEMMDMARVAFLAEKRVFVNAPEVSVRLFKLFKELSPNQCIFATRMASVGGLATTTYCVRQLDIPSTREERLKSIGSVNTRRIQEEGMPVSGWIVDVEEGTCGCLYHSKHAVCVHLVAAATNAGLPLPGLAPPTRRFAANVQRARRARRTRTVLQEIETTVVDVATADNEANDAVAQIGSKMQHAICLLATVQGEMTSTTGSNPIAETEVAGNADNDVPIQSGSEEHRAVITIDRGERSNTTGTNLSAATVDSQCVTPHATPATNQVVIATIDLPVARRSGRQRRPSRRAAESAEQTNKRRRQ